LRAHVRTALAAVKRGIQSPTRRVAARSALTTFMELIGVASIAFGCGQILPALGYIAAGIGLIAMGWFLA